MKKATFITIIVLSIFTISLFGAAKDTTPPTVSITNPKDNAVVSGVVTIKVDASDSSGIAKVEFYVGDSKLGEDSSKPYEYSWDTKKIKDGTYVITVRATDGAGNKNSKSIKVVVKNPKVETWHKTFGGGDTDEANSIQQTRDGGYIVAGHRSGYVYILKLNAKGQLEWENTFGGWGDDDGANSIQQTTDGGYIVAGWTTYYATREDVYILKLDAKGKLEWQKTFGGEGSDEAKSIQQTTDGGYIVAGYSSGDVYILKLDAKGKLEWQKTFGGEDSDEAKSIQQTTDGGYIVAGYKGRDVYILKLNSKGQLEWQKTFGGKNDDGANSIQQSKDGGYIVTGWTSSFGSGQKDVYILKLNAKGELEWQKTFGGKNDDEANSIQQTADGGYIVAGWTESFGFGGKDVYILKLDAKGQVEWQKTFDGWYDDVAKSIQQTKDGGYIVAGWTSSFGSGGHDVYILKLNSKGEVEWQKTFGEEGDDEANSIQQTKDGGYIVAGWTESFGFGGKDVYILKLDAKGEVEWQKTFGGTHDDEANSIQQRKDGGYIVAGWTEFSDFFYRYAYILELNSKGEVECESLFGREYDDRANSIQKTKDGGYIVAGGTSSGSRWQDVYIFKLNSKRDLEWQKTFRGKYSAVANSIQQTTDGGYIVAGWTNSFGSGREDIYILKLNSKGEVEWQKMFGGEYDDEANSIQQTTDGGYIVAGCKDGDVYILKLNSKGEIEK